MLRFYVIAAMQKYLYLYIYIKVDLSYPKCEWLALPWESADRPCKPWESSVLFWDLAAPSSKAVSIALSGGLSHAFLYYPAQVGTALWLGVVFAVANL